MIKPLMPLEMLRTTAKLLLVGIFYSYLYCLLIYPSAWAENQGEKELKVGAILPLSGPLAAIGNAIKNGLILASEENKSITNLQLYFEDDSFVPKNTVTAAQRLLSVQKVSALVTFGSSTSLAVADLAEKSQTPMVAIATNNKIFEGKRFVVRHLATPQVEINRIMRELQKFNYRDVAIVSSFQDGMLALRDEFIRQTKSKIALNEEVSAGETDFRSIATKIKQINPAAVFLLLLPPQSALFSRQLRELKYDGPMFAGHQIETLDEITSAGPALYGTWYISLNVISDLEFTPRYRNRFGIDPYTCAGNGYDVGKLLALGANTPDLLNYLHQVKDFKGVIGTYSASGDNGFDLPVRLRQITENGIKDL